MDLIQNKYHIIRIGDFATNGNTKLLYGVFACILCIDDYISNNSSSDCLTIMADRLLFGPWLRCVCI